MASAAPTANFTTIENCATTAAIATESLKQAGLHPINMMSGIFSISLSRIVAAQKTIGFAYLDVNHTHKNTFEYFNQCLRASDENSIFVFRGIHRSRSMEDVWTQICKHPRVTVSIDLFELGLVFFRKGLSKQDFVIRF